MYIKRARSPREEQIARVPPHPPRSTRAKLHAAPGILVAGRPDDRRLPGNTGGEAPSPYGAAERQDWTPARGRVGARKCARTEANAVMTHLSCRLAESARARGARRLPQARSDIQTPIPGTP